VPASHVYVHHIASENDDGVRRLPDPDPDDPRRSAEQVWWPPVMLRPDWVHTHAFDVFHIQFGFDAWDPGELARLVDALRVKGTPLVYTVHDLRNPHHGSRGAHDAQLDVLIPAADTVVTLTEGAAAEIRRRWRREAVVIPHPHVVPFERMRRVSTRPQDTPFRIGLHVKSLRASMDPLRLLPQLIRTAKSLPDTVLQVNGHRDVLEPNGARRHDALANALVTARDRGDLELHVHDFMPDDDLWDYLESLDVSVLPYRFGTHSGWLEACRDLGTAVVAPSCGYYADQGPVQPYLSDENAYDEASLHGALVRAHTEGPPPPLTVNERRAQRASIAATHREIYRRLIATSTGAA
jgi:glycosyltransferase involved in cell wall biosynthesis